MSDGGREKTFASHLIPMAEAAVAVAVLLILGAVIPGQWGLLELQPHPLWLVVIAIAVRYGSPSGYLVGALAAAAYWVLVLTRPESRFEPIPPAALVQVFLLFLVGVLVAESVTSRDRRIAALEDDLEKRTHDLDTLAHEYEMVCEVKDELQRRIVDRGASLSALRDLAKRLTQGEPAALYSAILEVLRDEFEARASVVHILDPDGQLRYFTGYPESLPGRAAAPHPSGLIAQAVAEQRVVTLRDRLVTPGTSTVDGAVMMAGPLVDSRGCCLGAVSIEDMPLLKLTASNSRLFELILDLAGDALGRAEAPARSMALAQVSTGQSG